MAPSPLRSSEADGDTVMHDVNNSSSVAAPDGPIDQVMTVCFSRNLLYKGT